MEPTGRESNILEESTGLFSSSENRQTGRGGGTRKSGPEDEDIIIMSSLRKRS